MIKRINRSEIRKATLELLNDQLFCNMFEAIQKLSDQCDDISAPEAWWEAKKMLRQFCATPRPDLAIDLMLDEMEERYAVFEYDDYKINRPIEKVSVTMFIVTITMLYMICAEAETIEANPHRAHCLALAKWGYNNPLRWRFMEDVRVKESLEEQAGHRVGVVNYLLHDVEGNNVDEEQVSRAQDEIMDRLVDVVMNMDESAIGAHERSIGRLSREMNHRFESHLARLAGKSEERVNQQGGTHVDYVENMTQIPHVKTFNGYVKEQNNHYPQPIIGGNDTKHIEE